MAPDIQDTITPSLGRQKANSAIAQLEAILKELPKDQDLRCKLYNAAHDLVLALEAPGDTILRILDIVSTPPRHLTN